MNKRIAHLSEQQLQDLIDRYYKKEKIADLLKEFNVSAKPSELLKLFPPKQIEEKCPYCSVNLVEKYSSREYSWRKEYPQCPNCDHTIGGYCRCVNCIRSEKARLEDERLKAQRIEDEKSEFLRTHLQNYGNREVELESLSFSEKVYLGALLREGLSEDFLSINPIDIFHNPLAPTNDFRKEMVEHLYDRGIIAIHPESDLNCFSIDLSTGEFSFQLFRVRWVLNVWKEGTNKVPLIEEIINPKDLTDFDEAYLMWRKIALNESVEYLSERVKTLFRVDYKIGPKTLSVIEDLLNDFSASQIFGIFKKQSNDALAYSVEKGLARHHAVNT